MSEYEAEVYEKFSSRVQRQVQSLRVLLESLQAKGKERHWLRHQTSGDLDDAKLIDGLTGEKTIYKKRADQEPEVSEFDIVSTTGLQITVLRDVKISQLLLIPLSDNDWPLTHEKMLRYDAIQLKWKAG